MKRLTYQLEQQGDGGGGGAGGGDWRSSLPEAIRGDASLQGFKDPAALAQSYLETKKLVGASLRPPGPDAAPEAHKEFAEKLSKSVRGRLLYLPEDEKARAAVEGEVWGVLGRPAKPEEYGFEDVQLEPGVELDQAALRGYAAKLGLTKAQAKELFATVAGERAAALRALKDNQAALKKELGAAYDERLGAAAAAAGKVGASEAMVKALREGSAPLEQVKVWIGVAKAIGGEQSHVAGQGAGGTGKLTPDEALGRAAEIRQRAEYWDRSKNPALHDELKRKHVELMAQAYPEEAA